MAEKHNNINSLSSKMQRSHSQFGNSDVLALHELPRVAAACHSKNEEVEMVDFLPEASTTQDDFLPMTGPRPAVESPPPETGAGAPECRRKRAISGDRHRLGVNFFITFL